MILLFFDQKFGKAGDSVKMVRTVDSVKSVKTITTKGRNAGARDVQVRSMPKPKIAWVRYNHHRSKSACSQHWVKSTGSRPLFPKMPRGALSSYSIHQKKSVLLSFLCPTSQLEVQLWDKRESIDPSDQNLGHWARYRALGTVTSGLFHKKIPTDSDF